MIPCSSPSTRKIKSQPAFGLSSSVRAPPAHRTLPSACYGLLRLKACALCSGLTCRTAERQCCGNRDLRNSCCWCPVPVGKPSYLCTLPDHICLSSTGDALPARLFIFRPSSRAQRSLSKREAASVPMCDTLRWACTHACHRVQPSRYFFPSTFWRMFSLHLMGSLTPQFFSPFAFLISRGITMFIHLPPKPHLSSFRSCFSFQLWHLSLCQEG